MVRNVREAALRDHFRHRSKLDSFHQVLFADEDSDRVSQQPAESMDFDTFCATISAMYGKHGLCPPFKLREVASAWLADGIAPEHCLAVVDRFLREHAPGRRSGSLDGLLPYLDKLIRFEWNRAHPTRPAEFKRREEPRPEDSLDGYTTRSRAPRITEADWLGDY